MCLVFHSLTLANTQMWSIEEAAALALFADLWKKKNGVPRVEEEAHMRAPQVTCGPGRVPAYLSASDVAQLQGQQGQFWDDQVHSLRCPTSAEVERLWDAGNCRTGAGMARVAPDGRLFCNEVVFEQIIQSAQVLMASAAAAQGQQLVQYVLQNPELRDNAVTAGLRLLPEPAQAVVEDSVDKDLGDVTFSDLLAVPPARYGEAVLNEVPKILLEYPNVKNSVCRQMGLQQGQRCTPTVEDFQAALRADPLTVGLASVQPSSGTLDLYDTTSFSL